MTLAPLRLKCPSSDPGHPNTFVFLKKKKSHHIAENHIPSPALCPPLNLILSGP